MIMCWSKFCAYYTENNSRLVSKFLFIYVENTKYLYIDVFPLILAIDIFKSNLRKKDAEIIKLMLMMDAEIRRLMLSRDSDMIKLMFR